MVATVVSSPETTGPEASVDEFIQEAPLSQTKAIVVWVGGSVSKNCKPAGKASRNMASSDAPSGQGTCNL